jgi:N-acetyltransferase
MNLQPTLKNDILILEPLQATDFEALFAVANDPKIWEQHPNPNRFQRPDFQNYFKGAMESGGALLIRDAETNEIIGSSRYTQLDLAKSCIQIGYTFLARSHWGGKFNPILKKMMMNHAFQTVENVHFYIGSENLRSQIAMERIGGKKIGEEVVAYFGEASKLNFIYEIKKEDRN